VNLKPEAHGVELTELIAFARSLLGDGVSTVAVQRGAQAALRARGFDVHAAEAFAFKVVRAADDKIILKRRVLVVAAQHPASVAGQVIAIFDQPRADVAEKQAAAFRAAKGDPSLFITTAPLTVKFGDIVPVPCARCGKNPRIIEEERGCTILSGCGDFEWSKDGLGEAIKGWNTTQTKGVT